MKIRTDFVTNSSSSSYIFKEYDKKSFVKAALEGLEMFLSKEGSEYDLEWLEDWFGKDYKKGYSSAVKYMFSEIHPIQKCSIEELSYILCFFDCEICEILLNGTEHFIRSGRQCEDRDHYRKILSGPLSDQIQEKIAGYIAAVYMTDDLYDNFQRTEYTIFTENILYDHMMPQLYNEVADYFDTLAYSNYIENHGDNILEHLKKYTGLTAGEIAAKLFGNVYVYFDDLETHYLYGDVFQEMPICILGCNHMG